jgi:hypothetical protein
MRAAAAVVPVERHLEFSTGEDLPGFAGGIYRGVSAGNTSTAARI